MTTHPASPPKSSLSRRSLIAMIGQAAGGAVMYQAMSALAYAGESGFDGPLKLSGDPKGASVLVPGAGLAGLCVAYELRKAGYRVQVLEYNDRPGGRNWSLHGGDSYTELGGFTQHAQFDQGLYLNPGPWRIPHHHAALLHYCRLLKVALEPFCQVNYNAYVHSQAAFGGVPQRYRRVEADFHGHVSELLSKCVRQHDLDQAVTREDQERLLQAMRDWGALDAGYDYRTGLLTSRRRGYATAPGGGLAPPPTPSEPAALSIVLRTAATNLADLATHTLGLPYPWVIAALALTRVLVILPVLPRLPAPNGPGPGRPAVEGWYWASLLNAGTLGTALGDGVAEDLRLGTGWGTLALAAITLAVIALGARSHWRTKAGYWLAIVAVRAAGTTAGDWLAFGGPGGPADGLRLGLPLSTACAGAAFVLALVIWRPARAASEPGSDVDGQPG